VQFYVDDPGKIFFVRTVNDLPSGFNWDFNHPFFLLLNLAVGGTGSWPGPPDNTTPSPATMLVDYVRVYTSSSVPAPAMTAPSISVTAGQAGTSTVSLAGSAGSGRVYLSCSTDAPKAACAISSPDSLNQYTVDFSSASSATAMVSVNTTANTSAVASLPGRLAFVTTMGVFATLLVPFRRKRTQTVAFVAGILVLLLIVSCGGSGNGSTGGGGGGSFSGTPPGNYTISLSAYTVSNTTGSPDQTLSIPLRVN